VPLYICNPGEWYFVITCVKCGTCQPISHDPSQGKSKIHLAYRWTCLNCKNAAFYDCEVVERYCHPTEVEMRRAASQY
jgi:hypothetical protein